MKTKLTVALRGLLARVRARLGRWGKRFGDIKKMRVEGFEVIVFLTLLIAGWFFCTSWFIGAVVDFWRAALPRASWQAIIGAIGLLVLAGFLEEDYAARRAGTLLAAFFFWGVGAWTAWNFPHYPFGFLFLLACVTPFWLFTQVGVRAIECRYRAPAPAAGPAARADLGGAAPPRLAGQKG